MKPKRHSVVSGMKKLLWSSAPIHTKQAQSIRDSGWAVWGKVRVQWSGRTMHAMKASGFLTKLKAKENSIILMGTFLTVIGWGIKPTVAAPIQTSKERATRVSGKMINKMAKALRPGRKAPNMTGTMWCQRKRDGGFTPGQMGQLTMANGLTTKLTAREPIFGKMAEDTMASGQITTCRGTESTYTLMASGTTVSTWTIRKRVSGSTSGLMGDSTKDGGTRASNMA